MNDTPPCLCDLQTVMLTSRSPSLCSATTTTSPSSTCQYPSASPSKHHHQSASTMASVSLFPSSSPCHHPPGMLHTPLLSSLPPPSHSGSMLPFMINETDEYDPEDNEDELYKNFTTPSFGIQTSEATRSEDCLHRSCPSYSVPPVHPSNSDHLAPKKHSSLMSTTDVEQILSCSTADLESLLPQCTSPTLSDVKCYWNNCFKQFASLSQLVLHIEYCHIDPQRYCQDNYVCSWLNCGRAHKPFNARYKLLNHMRIHSGEKPNTCPFTGCAKAFSRQENLKIHIRSHTGEKPYGCYFQDCGKCFSNSSDRAKHQRTHFESKPYACAIHNCQKRYTDPSSLRKHMKTHSRKGQVLQPNYRLHQSLNEKQITNLFSNCQSGKGSMLTASTGSLVNEMPRMSLDSMGMLDPTWSLDANHAHHNGEKMITTTSKTSSHRVNKFRGFDSCDETMLRYELQTDNHTLQAVSSCMLSNHAVDGSVYALPTSNDNKADNCTNYAYDPLNVTLDTNAVNSNDELNFDHFLKQICE